MSTERAMKSTKERDVIEWCDAASGIIETLAARPGFISGIDK